MYFRLIYRSRCASSLGGHSSMLRDVVECAERNNGHDRITGFLIFDKVHFLQILEGERADVEATFARISADPRHHEIIVLHTDHLERREFPEWSMGGVVRSPDLEHLFEKYGWRDFEYHAHSSESLVAFAREIADWEDRQKQARGLSAR